MSTPLDWNAIQFFSDNVATYRSGLTDGKAVLEPLENYGDYRRPRSGRAYQFDGTDDAISIPSIPIGLSDYSIVATFFQPAVATGQGGIFQALSSNHFIGFSSSTAGNPSVVSLGLNFVTRSFGFTLPKGIWYRMLITVDRDANATLYVDDDAPKDTVDISDRASQDLAAFAWFGTSEVNRQLSVLIRDTGIITRLLTAQEIADYYAGTFDLSTFDRFYHCEEESGTTAFNAAGTDPPNHGTIVGADTSPGGTFHVQDSGVLTSSANSVGYTENAGVIVPRNEAIPAEDVQGNPLEFSGNSPLPATIDAPIFTADGIDDHILLAHLAGGETVTSFVGTSTPSISAGRIDFTAGTCGQLLLSDGTYLPLQERSGTTAFNVDGTGRHGTITDANTATDSGVWANRSTEVEDWCILHGGRMEGDVFVPGLLDDSAAANGSPITLAKGHFANPRSVLVFDPWAAPELSTINYPAESPPGELLRLTAPNQTKFRSEQGATELALGTAFANGDNKLFTVPAPLTGQDLADAIDYIQRAPAFLPAWAVNSNSRVHSLVR